MNTEQMGEFLKALRKSKGCSQQEIADLFHVSNKTISKWETGKGIPEMATLLALADFYEVSVDEILRGSRGKTSKISVEVNPTFVIHHQQKSITNTTYISLFISIMGLIMMFLLSYITSEPIIGGLLSMLFYLGSVLYLVLELIKVASNVSHMERTEVVIGLRTRIYHRAFLLLGMNFLLMIYSGFYISPSMLLNSEGLPILMPYINHLVLTTAIVLCVFILANLMIRHVSSKNIKLTKPKHEFYGISMILIIALIAPLIYQQIVPTNDPRLALSIFQNDDSSGIQYEELRFVSLMKEYQSTGIEPIELEYEDRVNQRFYFTNSKGISQSIDKERFQDMMNRYQYTITITDQVAMAYWMASDDTSYIQLDYFLQLVIPSIFFSSIGWILIYYSMKLVSSRTKLTTTKSRE